MIPFGTAELWSAEAMLPPLIAEPRSAYDEVGDAPISLMPGSMVPPRRRDGSTMPTGRQVAPALPRRLHGTIVYGTLYTAAHIQQDADKKRGMVRVEDKGGVTRTELTTHRLQTERVLPAKHAR